MVRRPSLEQCDRIHYLYHYGGNWHFYAILKSVLDDESGDTEPDVRTGGASQSISTTHRESGVFERVVFSVS
jgi:hypothetical protein